MQFLVGRKATAIPAIYTYFVCNNMECITLTELDHDSSVPGAF